MATAKKTTAKKTDAKKASAKKAPAKKSSTSSRSSSRSADGRSPSSTTTKSGPRIAVEASRQLRELTGKEVEGISGLERSDEGWTVHVDVLELRRVPNTTDILATYEVETDEAGELLGYRRVRRYARGVAGEE